MDACPTFVLPSGGEAMGKVSLERRSVRKHRKAPSKKEITEDVWTDGGYWTVLHGSLRRGRGRPRNVVPLFQVVAEKIPFAALDEVQTHVDSLPDISASGVYIAHDSMGTPRYIGRGSIFHRLRGHQRAHVHELAYFSFYIVREKVHEREVETLLIRAAGPSLHFNERKKRVDIKPGNISDYEAGTLFYERQQRRGRRRKTRRTT